MTPRPFISPEELSQQVSRKGHESEELINSLIRSIGRSVGISAGSIHWDHRSNIGDGGRDLVVEADHNSSSENFLPKKKSYWSIKSGANGLDKHHFRHEIRSHPLVQQWLKMGNKYVWCSLFPSKKEERENVEHDVQTMISEFNNQFTEDQFEFRWIDHVADAVNLHPAVVLQHMPIALSRRAYLRTLNEWGLSDEERTNWVDFDERNNLVNYLLSHFLANSTPNVVHLAGMSGIGKSRLVREACTRLRDLHGIGCLYCESYEQVKADLLGLTRLFGTDRHAILVIDEVPFDREIDVIESHFRNAPSTLRIVTISPAVRQKTQIRGNRILLGEPSGNAALLSVIKQAQGVLPDERLNLIASKSAQDLRFALRWIKEINRDPDAVIAITGGAMPLLDHIIKRSGLSQTEQEQLKSLYDAASCFIDVGVAGDMKHEVDTLKELFSLEDAWLGKAIDHARDYGLSAKSKNYVEATPRGLAEMVFAKRGWATVSRDLQKFFDSLPLRLQQKFLERCQDSSSEIREEVTAQLGNYFRDALSESGILSLESTQAAKIFSAWAQFDPLPALSWLKKKVDESSNEMLLKFTGNEGYGDYRGRRYIIWLCESLCRFPDLFFLCEAILFKLAIAENEPRIGNNATKVWRNMFWPTLSQVSTPFAERARLLYHRLKNERGEALKICIDCAFEVLQPKNVGMMIPPQIVGGRLVPEPWSATSGEELLKLRTDFALSFLSIFASLDREDKEYFVKSLAENLMPFVWLDVVANAQSTIGAIANDDLKTALVGAIRRASKIVAKARYGAKGAAVAQQLRVWDDAIAPAHLTDRIKFWIQQNPWDVIEEDSETNPFEQLAEEIVHHPTPLNSLCAELSDPRFNGTVTLATFCGKIGRDTKLDNIVRDWIHGGESSLFVAGYLQSRSEADTGLEDLWRTELDAAFESHPEYIGNLSAYVDASVMGYRRIAKILDRGYRPVTKLLLQLKYGNWPRSVTSEVQQDVCKRLRENLESEPTETIRTAFDLLYMWSFANDRKLPQHLFGFAWDLLRIAIDQEEYRDTFKWLSVASHLVKQDPHRLAELIVQAEVGVQSYLRFESKQLDELIIKCAEIAPAVVMKVLGEMFQDDQKYTIYSVNRHEGVFETIGIKAIEEWHQANGDKSLARIASHLTGPSLDENGGVVLSEVLNWLFTAHEYNDSVFQGFLDGRHRLEAWFGDEKASAVENQMQVFKKHSLRRVREWADFEIKHWRHMQEWFDEIDEKRERG